MKVKVIQTGINYKVYQFTKFERYWFISVRTQTNVTDTLYKNTQVGSSSLSIGHIKWIKHKS